MTDAEKAAEIPPPQAGDPRLIVGIDRAGSSYVIRLRGDLGRLQIEELDHALRPICTEPGVVIALDCSSLNFVGSSGLGTLVGLQKLARQSGGSIRMAAARPTIAALMKMTRLDLLIPTFETVEQSLAAASSES